MKSDLESAFAANFELAGELGASVSVWRDGAEVASLHGGYMSVDKGRVWTGETLVPVFSATKGAASATFLLALHRGGYSPQMQVGELWPLFPLPEASVAEVMSHQCGLAALAHPADLFDHEACVRAIEQTAPRWEPPEHGYHPHTFGPMMDELMLRLTGERVVDYWEREVRAPLGIDFYLRLPELEFDRVATLYPAKADKAELESPFYREYLTAGTSIYDSFHSLPGLGTVRSMNTPKAWQCGSPALGGVASARGMAAFYQACLGNLEGIFPEEVRGWMQGTVVDGEDLTLMTPTAFSCGLMKDPLDAGGKPLRRLFGGSGFGHAGAGGSHAFALPCEGLSFAYTMNHMDLNVLPGKKTARLVEAVLGGMR